MAFKLPPITVLPGGRKVRDYDHLTVEYQAEQKAAEEKKAASKPKAEEEKPKQLPLRKGGLLREKAEEDESLG
jgi:hypothetical protein